MDKLNLFRKNDVLLPPAELEHAASELNIFRDNINKAFEFLKQHRKPNGFFFIKPKTPLFLVIGADTAGKSSLLTQSGLGLIDAAKQAISNPISTRYCHFWFSEKEIFVDTAGNYTTAGSTDAGVNLAWRGLIKMINSYRRRSPLSGLIIAVDLPSLAKDREKRLRILGNIKQRIYEIAKYAKNLPMFIVFTKSDLISGFKEFFADLTDDERGQLFGISFQDAQGKMLPVQTFNDKFTALLHNLSDRMLYCLHNENDVEKRGLIKDFPLQIEILKEAIAEIINEIPSNAETYVHGVYFTSSLQHGIPVDYLPTQFDESNLANQHTQSVIYPKNISVFKPYFISELFKNLVSPANPKKKSNILPRISLKLISIILVSILFVSAMSAIIIRSHNMANALIVNQVIMVQKGERPQALTVPEFKSSHEIAVKLNGFAAGRSEQIALIKQLQKVSAKDWADVDTGQLQKYLREAANYLDSALSGNNPEMKAWTMAKDIMLKQSLPEPMLNLQKFAEKQPEFLAKWLNELVDQIWHTLLHDAHNYIGSEWSSNVVVKYNANIKDRYPFFHNAEKMILLADFTDFFAPSGTIDKFFAEYLKPFVNTDKSYWVWKTVAGRDLEISQATLEMFIRANLIMKMFYEEGSRIMKVDFNLYPVALGPGVEKFALSIDGEEAFASQKKMSAYHMTWPGEGAGSASIKFVNNRGKEVGYSVTGPWAFFKLLEKSNLQPTGDPKKFELMFDQNGNAIKYKLAAKKAVNPFIIEIIRSFRCDETL